MQIKKISTWADITRILKENSEEPWIYRGLTRKCYPLVPKIGRNRGESKKGGTIPYDKSDETRLLDKFKKQAIPMINYIPRSDLEWLAIAQHHELKTRLLDWTENILVAAYFATKQGIEFEPDSEGKMRLLNPPVIYAIEAKHIPVAEDDLNCFNMQDEVMLYKPPHLSERIAPQKALFTIHKEPRVQFDHERLIMYEMYIMGTRDIIVALDQAGITESMLFPGIDGLARTLNWQHKWNTMRPF